MEVPTARRQKIDHRQTEIASARRTSGIPGDRDKFRWRMLEYMNTIKLKYWP